MLRLTFLAVSIVTCSGALASFDLMLLPSADGRIYRYDPLNDLYLGSYSAGTPSLIAANAGGTSISGSTGGSIFRTHNYSTGENQGQVTTTTGIQSIDLSGTTAIYLAGSSVIQKNIVSGSLVNASTLSSTNISWETGFISGSYYTAVGINTSTNAVVIQQVNLSTFVVGSLITTTNLVQAGSTLGKGAWVTNAQTGSAIMTFTEITATGFLSYARASTAVSGLYSSSAFTTVSVSSSFSSASYMPALMSGHNGFWLVGQDSTTSTLLRLTQYDLGTSTLFSQSRTIAAPGTGINASIVSGFVPANIVAPEPATVLALGAGLGALVRRRTKKSS